MIIPFKVVYCHFDLSKFSSSHFRQLIVSHSFVVSMSPPLVGFPPRLRRANAVQPFPLGSIAELPEQAGCSIIRLQQAEIEEDAARLSIWQNQTSSEDVRVNEGLYLSTSVDAGTFGRPRELRSPFVRWGRASLKYPVRSKWSMDRECAIWYVHLWINLVDATNIDRDIVSSLRSTRVELDVVVISSVLSIWST